MPAAQGEVSDRKVRFTFRFRRTITIAARPVVSSPITGPTTRCANDGFRRTIRRAAPCDCSRRVGYRIGGNDTAARRAEPKSTPANDQSKYGWERLQRRTPDARAVGALQRKWAFRGTNRPRGNEGVGEHVRTRFHIGLGPVKLRVVKDTRTERRKPVSSAGPVLKEALPKCDPAV